MPRERHYGLKVRFSNGLWSTYWYGLDKNLRDQKYREYIQMTRVLAVKKIQIKA